MFKEQFSNILAEKHFKDIIVDDLILKQNYKNIMEIPKIDKIVLNSSSKHIVNEKKYLIPTLFGLELISGQKLNLTKAKKSIATFKLRKNQTIGGKVTLREYKKICFLEKLIKITLPRLSEYHGTSFYSFDEKGNLNIGIKNILIFPELENYFQYFENISGINICIQTSTKNRKEAHLLFSSYQLPILSESLK
jgi:large subunit ribosomal protein L5